MAKNTSFSQDKKISKQKARRRRYTIYSLLVTLVAILVLYYLLSRPSGDISIVENGSVMLRKKMPNPHTMVAIIATTIDFFTSSS